MKTGSELIKDIETLNIPKDKLAFWWLGQLSYAFKSGSTTIYMDLFLSDMDSRKVPSLLKPQDITNADYIFGSHDHIDHIDRDVWKQLSESSPKAKFVVPQILVNDLSKDLDIPLDRFIGINDSQTIEINGMRITGIAAAHEFLDKSEDGLYPYLGFVIEINGRIFYHSGDTCIYEGLASKLKTFGKIDAMFIPINGRDGKRLRDNIIGNMTYQEAVDLAGSVNPSIVIPGHYEMFEFNSTDPSLFADYIDAKYPLQKFWIGDHGEAVIL